MSHFEPAHARKVFPCFDEPSFKASFTISITHDPEYYALSNMPRARLVTRKDGLVEEHFAPSVNMSSYLVAFAVLDFKYKEKRTDSGVLVRLLLLLDLLWFLGQDHDIRPASGLGLWRLIRLFSLFCEAGEKEDQRD